MTAARKTLTIALAGSPNTGKSSIFNRLTGLSQHVGNWPGKTVERKTGLFRRNGMVLEIVDLPGAYTLGATSPEEEVTREFLAGRPDAVVAVADASNLERSLYLVAELIEFGGPLVVALNMMDVAQSEGVDFDVPALRQILGVPVVPMIANRGEGVDDIPEAVAAALKNGHGAEMATQSDTSAALVAEIDALVPPVDLPYPRRWAILKLLEGDAAVAAQVSGALPADAWAAIERKLREHEDAPLDVIGARYEWAAAVARSVTHRRDERKPTLTDRADHILTHSVGGIAAFLGVLAAIYFAMFGLGVPLQHWLDDNLVSPAAGGVRSLSEAGPDWLGGLLADGVIGGAGLVLTFAPILAVLFVALALLEDSGYMARIAFVMDRYMHKVGLRGQSSLPLFLGFGCNVAGILGTRILASRHARLATILVTPLTPCAARMAVVSLLAAAFFGAWAIAVTLLMVALNLVVLAVVALVLGRFVFKGEDPGFLMELPRYHIPSIRTALLVAWQRLFGFLRLAGTMILATSVVVWALSTFPGDDITQSALGSVGRALEPVGSLMGLDWRMIVGLLTSFVAKENTIATLGVILGTEGEGHIGPQLTAIMTPAAALGFIALQMLFIPCISSIAAIRRETASWRWTGVAVAYPLVISILAALAIYQTGRLFGGGV